MSLKILVTRFNSEVQKGMKITMISWLLKMLPIVTVSTGSNILFATENYSIND